MKKKCYLHKKNPINLITEFQDYYFFGKTLLKFGICSQCGHIFQSHTVSYKKLDTHYKKMLIYYDNIKKPTLQKITSVKRHLSIIKHEMKTFPKRVLEVSSMNPYNLLQFKKNGSKYIEALEPNSRVSMSLKNKFDIKVHNCKIENYNSEKKYDLIILTHVLEHIFDPLKALKTCYKIQKFDQKILVEVPLFEKVENYKVGALHLEHLQYFSEATLIETLTKSGYQPEYISKIYNSTPFPFITILASKKKNLNVIKSLDYKSQLKNIKQYIFLSKNHWKKIDLFLNKFIGEKPIYLYGAGFFTSNLLHYTSVSKKFNIEAIIDSSPIKQGKTLANYKIIAPKLKNLKPKSIIIIASESCQDSIYESIKRLKSRGFLIVRLFRNN